MEDLAKVETGSVQETPEQVSEKPPKKNKIRCGVCRKKLGLTGNFKNVYRTIFTGFVAFKCRCGLYFCGIHRYSDKHDCQFDYKVYIAFFLSFYYF